MSQITRRLESSQENLARLLTRDHGEHLIEVALYRAEQRVNEHQPVHGERGGSSSPVEAEERAEDRKVSEDAAWFLARARVMVAEIERLSRDLSAGALRMLATIDYSKLPSPREPGCRSCARTEQRGQSRIGGHFAPVYAKSEKRGLCRWCWDFERAEGELPPVQACEIYHVQGARSAGLWLAKRRAA